MGACCESNRNQLIIDQIIAEDNMRRAKATRPPYMDNIYDENKVKAIQSVFLRNLHRIKFFKQFLKLQSLMIQELQYNLVTAKDNLQDTLSPSFITESKLPRFIDSEYYKSNILKYINNKFLIKLPPVYVDILHNTDIYQGTWNISKKFHGFGVLRKSDGSKYEGFWNNGILQGFCRYFTKEGDYFEGIFENGSANGLGYYQHYDGNYYRGEWKNDQPNGMGEEYFINDNSKFEGTFLNGKKEGSGTFFWADSSTYRGYITNDSLNGIGEYKWADGRRYLGEWKDNQMHGKGSLFYPDCSSYVGELQDNLRHGVGKYTWNEKKYYDGCWNVGKQHGKGRYFRNGKLVEGIWHNGKLMNHQLVSSNLYKPPTGYYGNGTPENTSGFNNLDSKEYSTLTHHQLKDDIDINVKKSTKT